MDKKKILLIVSSVALAGFCVVTSLTKIQTNSFTVECVHSGYHYKAKSPTATTSGWKEFWSCCKCNQSWTSKPSEGTFVDNTADKMSGGVGEGHCAYIAPYSTGVSLMNSVVSDYLEQETYKSQYDYLSTHTYGYGGYDVSNDYQNVDLTWDDDGSSSYTVTISLNSSFDPVLVKDTIAETSYNYGFYVPGNTYYYKVTGTKSTEPIVSSYLKINENEVRYVNVDGGNNMRDLGGWETVTGEHINYELLYRGCNLNGNTRGKSGSSALTEEGKRQMKEILGMKTEIDLRTPDTSETSTPNGDDDQQYKTGCWWDADNGNFLQASTNGQCYDGTIYWPEYYAHFKTLMPKIFNVLSNVNSYPVYFHCNAGADRTGTIAFILNGLLGVPYESLIQDFELTSFSSAAGLRWRTKKYDDTVGFHDLTNLTYQELRNLGQTEAGDASKYCSSLDALYILIMERYATKEGDTLQTAIKNWLIDMNVTQEQINSFMDIMLSKEDYSKYKDKVFNVSLKNTGSDKTVEVKGASTCEELLETPVRKGYEFIGWYDLSGNKVNPYARILENKTIVAGWNRFVDDETYPETAVLSWTSEQANTAMNSGSGGFTHGAVDDGSVEFGTRTSGQGTYTLAFPKIDFSSYPLVKFTLRSQWTNTTMAFGNSISEFYDVSDDPDMQQRTITIKNNGDLFVDGTKLFTLDNDVLNGNSPLWIRSVIPTGEIASTSRLSGFLLSKIVGFINNSFADVMSSLSYINSVTDYSKCDIEKMSEACDSYELLYNTLSSEEKIIYPYSSKVQEFRDYLATLTPAKVTFHYAEGVEQVVQTYVGTRVAKPTKSYMGYILDGGFTYEGKEYDFSSAVKKDMTIYVNCHRYASLGCAFASEPQDKILDDDYYFDGVSDIYKVSETGYNISHVFKTMSLSGLTSFKLSIKGDSSNNISYAYMMAYYNGSIYGSFNDVDTWHDLTFTNNGGTWTMSFSHYSTTITDFSKVDLKLNPGTYYITNLMVIE